MVRRTVDEFCFQNYGCTVPDSVWPGQMEACLGSVGVVPQLGEINSSMSIRYREVDDFSLLVTMHIINLGEDD